MWHSGSGVCHPQDAHVELEGLYGACRLFEHTAIHSSSVLTYIWHPHQPFSAHHMIHEDQGEDEVWFCISHVCQAGQSHSRQPFALPWWTFLTSVIVWSDQGTTHALGLSIEHHIRIVIMGFSHEAILGTYIFSLTCIWSWGLLLSSAGVNKSVLNCHNQKCILPSIPCAVASDSGCLLSRQPVQWQTPQLCHVSPLVSSLWAFCFSGTFTPWKSGWPWPGNQF